MTAERTYQGAGSRVELALAVALSVVGCGGGRATVKSPTGVTLAPTYELLSEDLELPGPAGAIPATVTRPRADGRFPGVVLLADGDGVDRDWNQPGLPGKNGSGRLLAEALGRHGVVVVRFDQLGSGGRSLPAQLSWAALLHEGRAARAWLAEAAFVDSARIFVAGHGDGGLSALRLASGSDPFAGLLLLAVPGRPLAEVVLGRLEEDFRAIAGLDGDGLEAEMAPLRDGFAAFLAGGAIDPAAMTRHVNIQRRLQPLFDPRGVAAVRERYRIVPAEAIAQVRSPILILGGGKDLEISPTLDVESLREPATLGSGDVTIHISPNADHALKREEMPRSELARGEVRGEVRFRYNADDRRLDDEVVTTLVGWLEPRCRPAAATPAPEKPGP